MEKQRKKMEKQRERWEAERKMGNECGAIASDPGK